MSGKVRNLLHLQSKATREEGWLAAASMSGNEVCLGRGDSTINSETPLGKDYLHLGQGVDQGK